MFCENHVQTIRGRFCKNYLRCLKMGQVGFGQVSDAHTQTTMGNDQLERGIYGKKNYAGLGQVYDAFQYGCASTICNPPPPIQNQGMVTILNVVINTKRQVLIIEITKKITFSIVLQQLESFGRLIGLWFKTQRCHQISQSVTQNFAHSVCIDFVRLSE